MSTNPTLTAETTTDRTTTTITPRLTTGKWAATDESPPTDSPGAQQQFSTTCTRRLPNLVDEANRAMLE